MSRVQASACATACPRRICSGVCLKKCVLVGRVRVASAMRDNESSSADPFAKIHTEGGSAAQLCEVASVRVVVRGEVDPAGRGRERERERGIPSITS